MVWISIMRGPDAIILQHEILGFAGSEFPKSETCKRRVCRKFPKKAIKGVINTRAGGEWPRPGLDVHRNGAEGFRRGDDVGKHLAVIPDLGLDVVKNELNLPDFLRRQLPRVHGRC